MRLIASTKIQIIVLSDRVSSGEYEDRSGVLAKQMLERFFKAQAWQVTVDIAVLPDEAEQLTAALKKYIANNVDIIFTVGSTGIGSRDIAPEAIAPVAEKYMPGIMEYIRVKYGATIPGALLSRSVACISGRTQIYAIPGSVKAVAEYVTEIMNVLEHATQMVHDLGHKDD